MRLQPVKWNTFAINSFLRLMMFLFVWCSFIFYIRFSDTLRKKHSIPSVIESFRFPMVPFTGCISNAGATQCFPCLNRAWKHPQQIQNGRKNSTAWIRMSMYSIIWIRWNLDFLCLLLPYFFRRFPLHLFYENATVDYIVDHLVVVNPLNLRQRIYWALFMIEWPACRWTKDRMRRWLPEDWFFFFSFLFCRCFRIWKWISCSY